MSKNQEVAKECGAWYAPTTDNITFPSRKELDVYTASVTDELQRQNAIQLNMIASIWAAIPAEIYFCAEKVAKIKKYLTSNTDQSAAWLEASHIEWLSDPVATVRGGTVEWIQPQAGKLFDRQPLYAIPTKRKE